MPLTSLTGAVITLAVISSPVAAQAEDLRFESSSRVVVNQNYEVIPWSLTGNDLGLVDSVQVTLEHVATRESSDFDYASAPPFSGTFQFYDFERFGRYITYGPAYDADYNEMSVSPTYVYIRRASRNTLTATRSGRYVQLRAVTRQYTGGYPRWPGYRGAVVRYQRYVGGTWRGIGLRRVPASGVTTLRTLRGRSATYRVRVGDSETTWGSSSQPVRR